MEVLTNISEELTAFTFRVEEATASLYKGVMK
jgi:hypothetical protein